MPYDNLDVLQTYDARIKLFSDKRIQIKVYDSEITKKINDSFEPLADILQSDKPSILPIIELDKQADEKFKSIRADSLSRSRNLLIDLAHENYKLWKSFITLTFKENITNLDEANKKFNIWVSSVKRDCPDFRYIAVPEFQKRGAVHYHLISSLECGSCVIPSRKKIKTKDDKGRFRWLEFYDIKHWGHGFSSAFDLKLTDDKFSVALYITKYLYKDISNRLYGRRKIMHSLDLARPMETCTKVYNINDIFRKCKLVNHYEFKAQQKYQMSYQLFDFDLSDGEFTYLKEILNNHVI